MNENSTQRERLMAALSVAEQITAASPVIPYDISINARSVDIHVYRRPEDVTSFAAAFGLRVELREQLTGNGKPILEARGSMTAVSVRAWSLGAASEWPRYRAVLAEALAESEFGALVSLPVAAWAAAGGAA